MVLIQIKLFNFQVSAVLQGSGAVRQPVRIQTSATPIVAVAVSQAQTVLTLPPPHDTVSHSVNKSLIV